GTDLGAGVAERLEKLLVDYRRHLELAGIDAAPEFGHESPARTALTRALWQRSGAVDRLLREAAPTSLMVQLCAADDLGLLEPAPALIAVVRFVPRAAQPALAERAGGKRETPAAVDLQWTAAGHLAGAVRLVPLRSGAVELTWPASDGNH